MRDPAFKSSVRRRPDKTPFLSGLSDRTNHPGHGDEMALQSLKNLLSGPDKHPDKNPILSGCPVVPPS